MSISLACECGKKLAVKDELAGKKIKCPACQGLLTVPSLAAEKPARKRPPEPADEDDEEPQDEDRPRKKKKKKRAAKSNTTLWIGAGAGVLLLGFCCVGGLGGGWWFFLRGGPEKPILGRWGVDLEQTKRVNKGGWDQRFKGMPPQMMQMVEQELSKFVMEITADGNMTVTVPGKGSETGKWRNATSTGDTVTVESKGNGPNQQWEKMDFKVIDSNHLQINNTQGLGLSMVLKRL